MNHYIPDNMYNNMTPEERERFAFLEGDRQTMEYCDTIEDLTLELEDTLAAAESRSDDYLGDLLALQERLADKDDTIDELRAELEEWRSYKC